LGDVRALLCELEELDLEHALLSMLVLLEGLELRQRGTAYWRG